MISLIHPSRGRPEKSFQNSKEWIEKAGCDVELIVSLDKSDDTKRYSDIYFFQDVLSKIRLTPSSQIMMFEKDNSSVVEATNHAAKASKGDILLYLSDDFKCFDNWGTVVLKEFEGETRPLLIKVDDGLQPLGTPVLTIPIMNRALYEKLGYFWHPGYKSMFVDEDLYWTARKMGALKIAEHIKFEHHHVSVGKAENDETYRRSSANWDSGKAFYQSRRAQGFPL